MSFAAAMAVAMAVDAVFGWPRRLFDPLGHPVTWIGRLTIALDQRWNREEDTPAMRRLAGVAMWVLVVGSTAGLAALVQVMLPAGLIGSVLAGILAWPLVALRSLHDHVAAVAAPLEAGDMTTARMTVSMIVGRDPSKLGEAGIARAAIESFAENASDGIVAPVFWGALLGLPGIAAYKAINTLDSMIGHRTPRHEFFGWAAARADDAANLVPARATGLLFALVSARRLAGLAIMVRDAHRHRSPNAGWPEAAMAGVMGVSLSGPRVYADRVADEPWLNEGARDPGAADIVESLRIYWRAMTALGAVLVLVALL